MIPSWLPVAITATISVLALLLNFRTYLYNKRERDSDRAMLLYKETTAQRVAGLEEDIERMREDLQALAKEHDACQTQLKGLREEMDTLKQENRDLLHQLWQLQSPRRSRNPDGGE